MKKGRCPICNQRRQEVSRDTQIVDGKLVEVVGYVCPHKEGDVEWVDLDHSIRNYRDNEQVDLMQNIRETVSEEETERLRKVVRREMKRDKQWKQAQKRDMRVIDDIAEQHDRRARRKRMQKTRKRIRRYTED
ncbi:MAG TPA: hypothetical protein ACFE0H_12990 [Elainellaceae cyanobacterium]